jgi:hypothetical protein
MRRWLRPSARRYNRLYTLNATCTAADLAQYGPVLQSMVSSFQPPALPY